MRRQLCLVIALLAGAMALPAANNWLRLRSPHFELLTDAGERSGRQLLDRLETVRFIFLESIGGKAPRLPVRVFQFSSSKEFHRFEPRETTSGFHQGAPDRDYIAISGSGEESLRAARHEYMHILLNHGSATLPMWLEEGTAELYSTVELRPAGAVFGAPVIGHVRALKSYKWIPPDLFFRTGKNSPFFDQPNNAGLFYAQAWALAHLLNFAPAWRRHLPRFAELVDQGTPALLAFEPAFESSPERALEELATYVRDSRFATAVIPMPPMPGEAESPAQPMDADAVSLAQVELFLAVGKPGPAATLLESVPGPKTAILATARGLLALATKNTAAAQTHFAEAMKLGDQTGVPAFETAMLLRDARAQDGEVHRYLAEAIGRNPDYAEAHFILGLMAQRENRHRDAVASFEEGLRVLPRQASFWHAKALSHLELKQPELARRAALRAASASTTGPQLEMAQAALKLVGAQALAPSPKTPKPGVTVPDSWRPKTGAASVSGVLEQIDCFGASARFQVRPAEGPAVKLWVDKPGEVLLQDASSLTFTFSCGPQRPRKVAVEYEPQSGLPQSATGRVTAIHFLP